MLYEGKDYSEFEKLVAKSIDPDPEWFEAEEDLSEKAVKDFYWYKNQLESKYGLVKTSEF